MSSEPERIGDDFVATWHPKYDETEDDEPKYGRILHDVRHDTDTLGTVSERAFRNILDWKSPRVKGKIQWNTLERYLDAIRKCRADPDAEKMKTLVVLQGIGPPVASTILHFLYRASFPIFDRRTVGVLRYFGHIQQKSTGPNQYPAFRQAILALQKLYPKWTLREFDRAFFAFHKQNPALFSDSPKGCGKCRGRS